MSGYKSWVKAGRSTSDESDYLYEDVIALRNEIHRLEMLVEGMAEAAEEITRERDELRSFVVALKEGKNA